MTAARRTVKKRTKKPQAPLGLQALFNALQPYDFQREHGFTRPDNFLSVVGTVFASQKSFAFSKALARAADAEYPGREWGTDGDRAAHDEPDVIVLAGFWAGVAAAWYVMTAINGKDGGR